MLSAINNFYLQHEDPVKSCLLALRQIVLRQDLNIEASWKYGMPFFCYKAKIFCYLWVHKKNGQPYLGIVEGKSILHPELISGKRSRMKIMLFDPEQDLPIETIERILKQSLERYK